MTVNNLCTIQQWPSDSSSLSSQSERSQNSIKLNSNGYINFVGIARNSGILSNKESESQLTCTSSDSLSRSSFSAPEPEYLSLGALTYREAHRILKDLGIRHSRRSLRRASRNAGELECKLASKIASRLDKPRVWRRLSTAEQTNPRLSQVIKRSLNKLGQNLQRGDRLQIDRNKGFFRRLETVRLKVSEKNDKGIVLTHPRLLAKGGIKEVYVSLNSHPDHKALSVTKTVQRRAHAYTVYVNHNTWQDTVKTRSGDAHHGLMAASVSLPKKEKVVIIEDFEPGADFRDYLWKLNVNSIDEAAQALAECARRLIPVFQGVQHLHNKDVAHLDIKPENITLAAQGAKLADPDFVTHFSQFQKGRAAGTPDYMPENFTWEKFDDCKAQDRFALGKTLRDISIELADILEENGVVNDAFDALQYLEETQVGMVVDRIATALTDDRMSAKKAAEELQKL